MRASFKYYLDHFNNGRKFVIMGHSQGSAMLAAMMQTDVDPMPAIRGQMISAILLGGGTTVAPGTTVNGTFKNIPTCTKPTDTGCMIAFSSFDVASPPGANSLFGKSPDGNEVACTNPGPLAGNAGPYHGSYFPTSINNPSSGPTTRRPGRGHAVRSLSRCVPGQLRHQERLQLPRNHVPQSARRSARRSAVQERRLRVDGFGLHLVDWNLPLEELMDIVKAQAAAVVH